MKTNTTAKASAKANTTATATATTSRKAGAIVAAFNLEYKTTEDGRKIATKGAPVDAATLDKLTKATATGLVTLREYNTTRED